ncbi:MAG TPA: M48 family metallopeptidase [Bryobacteraceae bacterium]|nr:M48 family metallopeptidase [Bryobacteraceae bacterium]
MSRMPLALLLLILFSAPLLRSQPAAPPPATNFDAVAATNAYLATVPADKKARSDAYFEGGYWLILWDFLYGASVALLLLSTRLSSRMRSLSERLTRFRPLRTFAYWVQYLLATTALTFPLTVYEGFVRENQYGLATQTFAPWLGDQLKSLALGLLLGGLAVTALFGIVRRLPRTWHLWGAVAGLALTALFTMIFPVFIAPLFNQYIKLTDPTVRDPILSLARANGIPATEVYEVDASRQSTRISANVSGFMGTERITLNDNLLKRSTLPEIMSVMGHEMGHYVLNHVYKGLLFTLIVLVVFFAGLRRALDWSLARWGARWEIRGVSDPAVLPLAVLIVSIFSFLYTPIGNTVTRTMEYEADMYGLNAVRQPDAFATIALKLGEYRKLNPGPVEEMLLFDHPSGRTRIYSAMRWKAGNLNARIP